MSYPEIGEAFELMLKRKDPDVQPLAMVKNYGYDPEGWEYNGKNVKGNPTQKFKLIQVGGTWDEIGKVVGNDLEGQWLEAFRAKFSEFDDEYYINVYDDSWVDPSGVSRYPCIDGYGSPRFFSRNGVFSQHCLWIVPIKEEKRDGKPWYYRILKSFKMVS